MIDANGDIDEDVKDPTNKKILVVPINEELHQEYFVIKRSYQAKW